MYKKFLVSMLLTAALVGCNHQPSDTQAGDQSDTVMPPVQDQMANPANSDTGQMPVNPSAAEPTQTPPTPNTDTNTTTPTPAIPDTTAPNSGDATPANPATNNDNANSAAGAE